MPNEFGIDAVGRYNIWHIKVVEIYVLNLKIMKRLNNYWPSTLHLSHLSAGNRTQGIYH